MASNDLLQQLHHLNVTSPGFHDQLSNVLYGEGYKKCVSGLQDDDVVQLVDYLDKVCCCAALFHSSLRLPQVLGLLDPASSTSRKCLRELRSTCGTRMILPTSYTVSHSLLSINRQPAASGGSGDIYEGTLNGSRVCVKRVRVYSKYGPGKATKVRHRFNHFSLPRLLTSITDSLPGGRGVETFDTPKHRSPPGYHPKTSPAHLGMDAWWGSDGLYQEEPRRRPTWSRRYLLVAFNPTLTPAASYLMSQTASTTSTPAT